MRRPHPRFDEARNAWVTRAGGKLTILAKGPNSTEIEAAAWDAFYVHMAKLGQPGRCARTCCARRLLTPYDRNSAITRGAQIPLWKRSGRSRSIDLHAER